MIYDLHSFIEKSVTQSGLVCKTKYLPLSFLIKLTLKNVLFFRKEHYIYISKSNCAESKFQVYRYLIC